MNEGKSICRVCQGAHRTGECSGDARVSIPAIKRSDTGAELIDDQVSGPVKFFDVPQDPSIEPIEPLDDDEKTPVVSRVVTKPINPKVDTVTEFDLGDLRDRLVQTKSDTSKGKQKEVVVDPVELSHVFDDVKSNREAEVVGFIKRWMGNKKFEDVKEFKEFVKELFGGENDPVGAWKMEDLAPLATLTVELRAQIGESRPVVEVDLINMKGQGLRKGQNITKVGEVRMQAPSSKIDLVAEERAVEADPGLWKKATGWFRMTRKNPENK